MTGKLHEHTYTNGAGASFFSCLNLVNDADGTVLVDAQRGIDPGDTARHLQAALVSPSAVAVASALRPAV